MANVLGETLPSPPEGISQLHFSLQSSSLLLASGWDQTLRVYNTAEKAAYSTFRLPAPILDFAHPDDLTAYCGTLDGKVTRVALPGGEQSVLGEHQSAVRCVQHITSRDLLVTGSWDQTIKVWDPRAAQPCIKSIPLPGKVFAMSAASDWLVVGTSQRHVFIFDVRKIEFGHHEQQRESSLKFMTRSLAAAPDGRGYALGSVEGRVAMELFDQRPEVQALKYAFKCHRQPPADGKPEVVHPVHCIHYHRGYGTFATGGGDGVVNIWDGDNKKRLFQISKYPTSVSAMSFNLEGNLLAVASSYAYEEGDKPHEPDAIYVRPVDTEVRPKARPAAAAAPPPA